MNTVVTTNTGLAQDLVVNEFESTMIARGHQPSAGDLRFAELISSAWQSPQQLNEPVVFAAECGFGKSTLLELFLRHKTETDPQFGAIVVKQKKDEVEALVEAINRNHSDDGREQVRYKRAFAIRGYDPLRTTYRSYRNQFRYQTYFPVIVMTAEMFARQSTMKLLDRFSSFYDGEKIRRPRRLLLIDERPIITRNHSMSVDEINRLIEDVREVTHRRINAGDAEYYREFLDYAQRLRYELETCEGKRNIDSIDFNYILPDELRRDWGDLYEGEDFDSLLTFESTIRFGGTISLRRNGMPVITVSHRIYYEWTQYNPFILDATAKTDPYYASETFNIIEAPQPHLYHNVQFNICSNENLSKSFIEAHPQSIEETAKMVRDIVANHHKTMVVFYKEHLSKLEESLVAEIESGKVLTKHFDSGRATNDYKDCDAAIFLGWLLKGETYYPQVASAIYDELLSFDTRVDLTGLHYVDERVEAFKTGEIVTERVQDVHRIRPRASKHPVSVYLFHRDERIINKIIESFPGSTRKEYLPLRKLSGNIKHSDNLISYLREMEQGTRIKSKEIYEAIGASPRQFSRIQTDPRVVEAMRRFRVRKERTFYYKATSSDN